MHAVSIYMYKLGIHMMNKNNNKIDMTSTYMIEWQIAGQPDTQFTTQSCR